MTYLLYLTLFIAICDYPMPNWAYWSGCAFIVVLAVTIPINTEAKP